MIAAPQVRQLMNQEGSALVLTEPGPKVLRQQQARPGAKRPEHRAERAGNEPDAGSLRQAETPAKNVRNVLNLSGSRLGKS
jgi:hypothetical protein